MCSERAEARGPGVTELFDLTIRHVYGRGAVVEQTRLTLGHSNRGVPYPCVV